MNYEQKHKILVDYLHSKVDEADWRRVCEAANDLRVMEAEHRVRSEVNEYWTKLHNVGMDGTAACQQRSVSTMSGLIRNGETVGNIAPLYGDGLHPIGDVTGSVLGHPDNRSGQLEDAVTKYRYSPPVPDPFEI